MLPKHFINNVYVSFPSSNCDLVYIFFTIIGKSLGSTFIPMTAATTPSVAVVALLAVVVVVAAAAVVFVGMTGVALAAVVIGACLWGGFICFFTKTEKLDLGLSSSISIINPK